MNASKSAVGVNSLCIALQTMGDRLTHLYLAHNRLAGIPNIVSVLSVCRKRNLCISNEKHLSISMLDSIAEILSQFDAVRSLKCDHTGNIARRAAHRKAATWLSKAKSAAGDQLAYNPKHGKHAGNSEYKRI